MTSVSSFWSFLGKHNAIECEPPITPDTKPFIIRSHAYSLSDEVILAKRTVLLHRVGVR
jgi:hypothetical protein